MIPRPVVDWSPETRLELPRRAQGRRLLVDYFAARCCGGNLSVGDLHLHWKSSDEPIAEDFVALDAPDGIGAFVQRDLVPVLELAGSRIAMRGRGPLRRPVVELEDGAVWLDFIGACRSRSALRH